MQIKYTQSEKCDVRREKYDAGDVSQLSADIYYFFLIVALEITATIYITT